MSAKIAVGLESTLDIVIEFPKLENLKEFAEDYDGELSPKIKKGYKTIANGSGGEVPIDGKGKEAQEILERARNNMEAEISCSFGGNGPLEVATLENLGSETYFLGSIFPKSISEIPNQEKTNLKKTNMALSQVFVDYFPASYIYQAKGTDRYIHADGEGRRIDQMRSYLENLPDVIESVVSMYGELDALSIPDWHVLFGNSLDEEDFELVNSVIKKIRKKTDATLFTDAGGIDELKQGERRKLCNIYSLFDFLSINEDEIYQVTEGLETESENEVESLNKILEESKSTSTVWLHTLDYQISLSTEFERNTLEKAQENSALAGLYRVETGGFPTKENLQTLKNKRDYSEKGLKKKKSVKDEYGKSIDGKNLAVTPCFNKEKFFSSVGAGDVSLATYMHELMS